MYCISWLEMVSCSLFTPPPPPGPPSLFARSSCKFFDTFDLHYRVVHRNKETKKKTKKKKKTKGIC